MNEKENAGEGVIKKTGLGVIFPLSNLSFFCYSPYFKELVFLFQSLEVIRIVWWV